jgi:hypothetical protein
MLEAIERGVLRPLWLNLDYTFKNLQNGWATAVIDVSVLVWGGRAVHDGEHHDQESC